MNESQKEAIINIFIFLTLIVGLMSLVKLGTVWF